MTEDYITALETQRADKYKVLDKLSGDLKAARVTLTTATKKHKADKTSQELADALDKAESDMALLRHKNKKGQQELEEIVKEIDAYNADPVASDEKVRQAAMIEALSAMNPDFVDPNKQFMALVQFVISQALNPGSLTDEQKQQARAVLSVVEQRISKGKK